MDIDYCALDYWAHWVVSGVALLLAIGIPIWQRRITKADMTVSKHALLLQTISSAKSAADLSKFEVVLFLARVGAKINPEKRTEITELMATLQKLYDRLDSIHDRWLKHRKGLREIEQALLLVDSVASEVKVMAKISEGLRKGSS